MLIVQNDLDVNIDLQKRGRINRTGQVADLPPLYEYIITAIPSEKRLNMMLRAKLRSLSANTTANQDQDKRQADFIDISNKYGDLVTHEYLANNPELAFILGLKSNATASQLLARTAMLSVAAQQDIIEEVFSAYQNLEQELRRINQWDLEREYRDFEAQFVREELFTASVDESAIGGASMLTTFLCRHRTYPYDAKTLKEDIENAKGQYGENLADSEELHKEIKEFYRIENKKIREKFKARRQRLWDVAFKVISKYLQNDEMATQLLLLAERPKELWLQDMERKLNNHSKMDRIIRKLESYSVDLEDLEIREKRELKAKSEQRRRLMNVISFAVIGRCYSNIRSVMPAEGNYHRILAVLKEVRFDKNPNRRFNPGRVQFVFALSAVRKELVLNLVDKGQHNNYDRLNELLHISNVKFSPSDWDREIARYNNRILERKIITGNILGAFANPLIQKIKPHFITFSLASDEEGRKTIERGLLLPMSGENIEQILSTVTLPFGEGLRFANAVNHVYSISGIGLDLSITPVQQKDGKGLGFYISVKDKDSKKFESDTRFDSVRQYFNANQVTSIYGKGQSASKRPLIHYSTGALSYDSTAFMEIAGLIASLKAAIIIPREYVTVGTLKEYAKGRTTEEDYNWPILDWKGTQLMPPMRKETRMRISAPIVGNGNIRYVEKYSDWTLLCRKTLAYNGRSFQENTMPGQIRALYFEWLDATKLKLGNNPQRELKIISKTTADIHSLLVNSSKYPIIRFDEYVLKLLQEEAGKEELSSIGRIIDRYKNEMLFLSPPKQVAEQFLNECLCSPRLEKIIKSLEAYICGATDIIIE